MNQRRKPHVRRGRFYNDDQENGGGFFVKSIAMIVRSWWQGLRSVERGRASSWCCHIEPRHCSVYPTITCIGHSSFLIQISGVNILTDPIFGKTSVLYPRMLKAAIPVSAIPPIDFVLISHNHRDHMDKDSLMTLRDHPGIRFLVPKGDKIWFDQRSFVRVAEHTWWDRQSFRVSDNSEKKITFSFLPARHWSQRGLLDKNRSLWGSWMIECDGHCIYFAGDSSYDHHFLEISKQYPQIHTALMPIGPCEPRAWVRDSHIDSIEAGEAFLDLGAKNLIPMHWGTFPMGEDLFDSPIRRMKTWWKEHEEKLGDKFLYLPKFGEPLSFNFSGSRMIR